MFTEASELSAVPLTELWDELRRQEQLISRSRARQLTLLREITRRSQMRPVSAVDIAGELDVSADTARALLDTASATPEHSDQMAGMAAGGCSFDRANAMARLLQAGAEPDTLDAAKEHDIAGINRLRNMTRRVRRRDEEQAHAERHVRSHTSLDESVGFISAQLPAYDWKLVTTALDHRADRFPAKGESTREQLRADALVAMAMDSLSGMSAAENHMGSHITILVDAERAGQTSCEAGVGIAGGPRIGPNLLEELMCGGSIEIVLDGVTGVPVAVGPTTDTVPPKTRRNVLARDGGCTVDACWSTYRLEVHHILPRGEGGTHDMENLTTLCWWHHHGQVHGQGNRIDPDSPPKRRKIIPSHRPP